LTTPEIFDRDRVRANLERAAATLPETDFLLRHAADELVGRIAAIKRPFHRAADVGAYHGVMARLLKERLPATTILSLSPVLALAEACPAPSLVADEEALPLKEASLDLVTSALSLQLVNDLPGTLIQIRRALRPDGLFLGALLGGDSLFELRQALLMAEAETAGGVSPRVFPAADIRDAGALLQRAGFALPVADQDRVTVTYADPLLLMGELKSMGWANPLRARSRRPMRRDTLARACQCYRDLFGADGGKVKATFEFLYVCGWAPHESQQKPLKPGSAAARLADALGTIEHRVNDATRK
jgi:NADH dehydrogenase [ubiquinone] 1 alpha subcomplex assembly factor 5